MAKVKSFFHTTWAQTEDLNKVLARVRKEKMVAEGMQEEIRIYLAACNANSVPLDFKKLLKSDKATFKADIKGIQKHSDKQTAILRGFVPNCADEAARKKHETEMAKLWNPKAKTPKAKARKIAVSLRAKHGRKLALEDCDFEDILIDLKDCDDQEGIDEIFVEYKRWLQA